jgi:hypothetical protein
MIVRVRPSASVLTLAIACALVGLAAACSTDDDEASRTLRVPADYDTVQAAVDEADDGDLILIEAGVYNESVIVESEGIVIRGVDRNTVILDGEHDRANGIEVIADGVAVENLTIRNYTQNGVIFNGALRAGDAYDASGIGTGDAVLDGYRVSYVTTANNGLYGIYAFASKNGIIEHSLASGHPDSGIYIGQCKPCNAVVRNVIAERNAIGYYGTNASGDVYVVESVFRNNRLGVAPNSQDAELLAPQEETVVAANLVADNDDPLAPAIPEGYFGVGIAVGGGTRNTVVGNRVIGHDGAGIALQRLGTYDPIGNVVRDNDLADNGVDLLYDVPGGAALDNCVSDTTGASSAPANLVELLPCDGAVVATIPPANYRLPAGPADVDHRLIVLPDPQPVMPDAFTAPPRPARGVPTFPDLTRLAVPEAGS